MTHGEDITVDVTTRGFRRPDVAGRKPWERGLLGEKVIPVVGGPGRKGIGGFSKSAESGKAGRERKRYIFAIKAHCKGFGTLTMPFKDELHESEAQASTAAVTHQE